MVAIGDTIQRPRRAIICAEYKQIVSPNTDAYQSFRQLNPFMVLEDHSLLYLYEMRAFDVVYRMIARRPFQSR